MKARVRFGYRALALFPNAGIAVIYMPWATFNKLESLINEVRALLVDQGKGDLAARFICEAS